jgi:hypothetical protein
LVFRTPDKPFLPNLLTEAGNPMNDLPIRTTQQRLNRVHDEVKRGLDRKLQGQPDALKHLERAYELARDPYPLDAPWPQITAYRLAHLLMREGLRTDWQRVDDLLREAGEDDSLGPAPLIYRLIALSKLNVGRAPSEEMEQVYKCARRGLDLVGLSGPGAGPAYPGDQRPLQTAWLNLLEAVVYMTGLEYGSIAGWAGPDLFAGLGFESSGWRVIEDQASATLQYPEVIARKVFDQRCKHLGDRLAVEVASAERSARGSLTGCTAMDLIFLVCGNRPRSDRESKDPQAALRTRKKRLRKALKKLAPELPDKTFDGWWDKPRGRPSDVPPIILLVGPEAWKAARLRRR